MEKETLQSELMILADGKVYAHNLTPVLAEILAELYPSDAGIRQRTVTHVGNETKALLPAHWNETHHDTTIATQP